MEAFYLVFGSMELSAGLGYTTTEGGEGFDTADLQDAKVLLEELGG